ncbi:MAG: calcium/sodium antiporter, partial [Sulfurospirillum sp.]|nr:calcium/sodium antiporter [Sulfurospirillum sp.]
MLLFTLAIILGLVLLIWSADKFIEGAASTANHLGMPPLLIGILVVGFGTSAPEMVVSAIAALEGNSSLALGNALGSNIVNIALILGATALISPIIVESTIIKKEMPLLMLIVVLIGYMLIDNTLTMLEGIILLTGFFLLIAWSVIMGLKNKRDALAKEVNAELKIHAMSLGTSLLWLLIGLVVLVLSSRLLVWGAVGVAKDLGISDLIIGLTIVALGTSLPELASSIIAARKGEHDIAIGNIVGSNMFNILAVIGIATIIKPMEFIEAEIFNRDWSIMAVLTFMLFLMAFNVNRT